jgi:cytochrome c553
MRRPAIFLATIALLSSSHARAAADITAGQQKSQLCVGCHGEHGISSMADTPSLAGQQDQFIQWQLVFFRSGRRPNPAMAPLVADLTDQDIRNLGAYFHSLPYNTATTGADPNPALSEKGRLIAAQHHCANCHTDSYRGDRAAAAIANQREDYLAKTLAEYKDNSRHGYDGTMADVMGSVTKDQIVDLAYYISHYR